MLLQWQNNTKRRKRKTDECIHNTTNQNDDRNLHNKTKIIIIEKYIDPISYIVTKTLVSTKININEKELRAPSPA